MNKSWLAIIAICFIILGAVSVNIFLKPNKDILTPTLESQTKTTPKLVDITAQFEIYTNGTKRIFTDPKYHKQSSEVYIELSDPSLIHVKKAGISWANFFDTLPMKLTDKCLTTGTGQVFCTNETSKLKFYINSVEQPNALNQIINQDDMLIVKYVSN